jgi:hypothetical protein
MHERDTNCEKQKRFAIFIFSFTHFSKILYVPRERSWSQAHILRKILEEEEDALMVKNVIVPLGNPKPAQHIC